MTDWTYHWYVFPFQLCSTPIYILPFIIFLKDGGVRDAFISYMALFSLFGGLVVYLYPNDVFASTMGINIQTMVHHGMQIVLGVFFVAHSRRRFNLKFFLKSTLVFVALVVIAIVSNEIMYVYITNKGIANDIFNMFYISRHYPCTLPILADIYKMVPYPVFALIYILGFAIVSFVIYLVEWLIIFLTGGLKKGNAEQNMA